MPANVEKTDRHSDTDICQPQDTLSIRELSPDEMDYDADIEVLRPDQYEELDSDQEYETESLALPVNADDELVTKIGRLSCDSRFMVKSHQNLSQACGNQDSQDSGAVTRVSHRKRTDYEVSEMLHAEQDQPRKKRRKKANYPAGSINPMSDDPSLWQDTSSQNEDSHHTWFVLSSSADLSDGDTLIEQDLMDTADI